MTKNGWVWTWHFCGSLEKNHQVAQTILHRNCTKCPQNKRRVISVDINSPATHSFHLPALLYSETLPPRTLVLERPNEVLNWLSTMKKNKHLNTCIWQNITSKCHCSVYSSLKEFHVSVSTRLAKLRSLPWIKQWSHKWKNV